MIHAVCLLLFSLAPALAQEPQAPPKPVEAVKCPVTGGPANLAISAPTKEGPVFFCTADCITRYRAEPDKFSEALARQRKALAQRPRVQVKCPVSGDPPDLKIFLEKDGQKIAFCSEECRKKYAADSARYASALANSFTHQTTCPVMGHAINPAAFVKLPGGGIVYFCCKGCDEKLLADPAKYAPALIHQGYSFDFTPKGKEDK